MKCLRKLYFGLLYLLPAILFFSYYPLISLGSDATMNFELSLPLIFLALFDFTAFLLLMTLTRGDKIFSRPSATNGERDECSSARNDGPEQTCRKESYRRRLKGASNRKFFLFALFPLYATLSIFWSANPTRAILTAGVLWITFFAAFAIIYITPLLNPAKSLWRTLIFSLFISTAVVCLFCWVQSILDVMNVSREVTLLCPGCTYHTFGFPHPSGFAIEPQFMGNLLLAPTLLALYFLTFSQNRVTEKDKTGEKDGNRSKQAKTFFSKGAEVTTRSSAATLRRQASRTRPEKRRVLACLICAILFSSTLFLTLSRGAIYAYAVALFILLVFALIRHQKWLYLIIIPVVTFLITLTIQGIFSAVSPTSDTFISGTTKILHQLSLGTIDLRPQTPSSTSAEPVENLVEDSVENSQFDGYIPASTNTRLGLNSVALETWLSSPYYVFFGVGLGGAGVAMSESFPGNEYAVPNAIVQNEAISLLLELGLVGIVFIAIAFILAFIPGRYLKFLRLSPSETSPKAPSFWQLSILPVFLALIIAYLITLNFFSGLANALQIYLLPPLIYLAYKNYCNSKQPVIK